MAALCSIIVKTQEALASMKTAPYSKKRESREFYNAWVYSHELKERLIPRKESLSRRTVITNI